MDGSLWLEEIRMLYQQYKTKCERAARQVADEYYLTVPDGSPHSIGLLMKHVGRNLRSRWRDFLTTDGEKPDRDRESEFSTEGETRDSVMAQWEEGWGIALDSLEDITPAGLERTITIRGEPMGVITSIHRNLNHVVYHTGQIVLLARYFTGEAWQTLSIAPGKSEEFNAIMREKYGSW